MNPTDKDKKGLTPSEKNLLMAQLNDYRRVLRRQLHTHQELLMLHMDLIPELIKVSAYQPYIERWAELMRALKNGKTIQERS